MSNSPLRLDLRLVPHSKGQQEEPYLDGAESGYEEYAVGGENGAAPKRPAASDRLLTVEQVAERLNVTKDWVWDHSSRRTPFLPVIRIGNAKLRYRAREIEEFIAQRERASNLKRKRG
jgi:predicted DNA-binding transcriptional regulator AlpA